MSDCQLKWLLVADASVFGLLFLYVLKASFLFDRQGQWIALVAGVVAAQLLLGHLTSPWFRGNIGPYNERAHF